MSIKLIEIFITRKNTTKIKKRKKNINNFIQT